MESVVRVMTLRIRESIRVQLQARRLTACGFAVGSAGASVCETASGKDGVPNTRTFIDALILRIDIQLTVRVWGLNHTPCETRPLCRTPPCAYSEDL